jgi:hypothetical protein
MSAQHLLSINDKASYSIPGFIMFVLLGMLVKNFVFGVHKKLTFTLLIKNAVA